MGLVRGTAAGKILGFKAVTVRKWANEGKLEYTLSAAGHRLYDEDYLRELHSKLTGEEKEEPKPKIIHYARSSNGKDIAIQTQLDALKNQTGTPDYTYTDKSSGLNDNRQGLNALLKQIKNHPGNYKIYITNNDRLTRFGYKYLENLYQAYNTEIISINEKTTKEPQEILMQDFMSLIASFSGKFYRLRGWENQRKLLNKAQNEIKNHE